MFYQTKKTQHEDVEFWYYLNLIKLCWQSFLVTYCKIYIGNHIQDQTSFSIYESVNNNLIMIVAPNVN